MLAASPTGEHNPPNEIASSSSTDETATTTCTDVATLLLSPPNSEMLKVIVHSPPTGSADEIATISTSSVLAPTNAVAFEVGPSEFAFTSSGHQPVEKPLLCDYNELNVKTIKMVLKIRDITLDYERVCLFELEINKFQSLTPPFDKKT
jgi:hypothetical protein